MESTLNGKEKFSLKSLNLKTKEGCIRLLVIFLMGILVFGFFGKLLQSDFGKINVQHVLIDVRGAILDGQLYYPNGTNSKNKLPAVVVAHGGSMNYGTMRGSASEIARRGFVVLSLSAYGSTLSTMPAYDESGNGVEGFSLMGNNGASAGLFDAIDYVRSMAIVDPSRVGLIGQSMGANRSGQAAVLDCGYYSFNDIMINVLYNTFGQEFSEEDINQNADRLAAARLNSDQLKLYNSLRATNWERFNTRLKAVIVVGLNWLPPLTRSADVEVAGHTVTRNVQTNVGYATGSLDVWRTLNTDNTIKSTWYSSQDITFGSWYMIDDVNKSSKIIGDFSSISVVNNSTLASAIQNRVARVLCEPVLNTTHTGICLSTGLFAQQAKFFEQTLGYNRGELGSSTAKQLGSNDTLGIWREVCNGLAMFCMFGMVLSLGSLILKTKTFSSCVIASSVSARPVFNKKRYWITAIFTFILTFGTIFYVNNYGGGFGFLALLNPTFPWQIGMFLTFKFVGILAGGTILILGVNIFLNKKETGNVGINALNIGIKFKSIIKSLAATIIIFSAAYGSLAVMDYFFGQDYRYFTMYFSYVRPDYWIKVIPTALILFFGYFIIGAGVNYGVRTDIPEWKDTLITVIVFSAGIWLACLINEFGAIIAGLTGTYNNSTSYFANFMNTYHYNITVPLVVLVSRVMYKRTNSLWLGAALCALLIAWSVIGAGLNDSYIPQTWLSNFLG